MQAVNADKFGRSGAHVEDITLREETLRHSFTHNTPPHTLITAYLHINTY